MNKKILSIREKLASFDSRKLSPKQNVDECLNQIDRLNPKINALTYIAKKEAKEHAERINSQGFNRGRLHGITFSAKDHYSIKGMPASEGSKQTFIPKAMHTDILIQKLIDQGAICIGKANQPEYGKSNFTNNALYGRTNNPWNQDYTAGGSTG